LTQPSPGSTTATARVTRCPRQAAGDLARPKGDVERALGAVRIKLIVMAGTRRIGTGTRGQEIRVRFRTPAAQTFDLLEGQFPDSPDTGCPERPQRRARRHGHDRPERCTGTLRARVILADIGSRAGSASAQPDQSRQRRR
jgi:hypothetical protein